MRAASALAFALWSSACGSDHTAGPPVREQVVDLLEARHGERFDVTFVGGGVNAGNLFDGPARTYEADLRSPTDPELRAHAFVRVEEGRVLEVEDDVRQTRVERELASAAREAARVELPELASVCAAATFEPGAEPDPASPKAGLRRVHYTVNVGGLDAPAVLAAKERVRRSLLALGTPGREPAGVEMRFFSGPVPPLLEATPCTTENTTSLTLSVPTLMLPLPAAATPESFDADTTAIGFGRRGPLGAQP